MSREKPTPDEIDAILAYQHGIYDVNLPHWYMTPSDYKPEQRRSMKALTIAAAILLLAGLVATAIGYGFTIFMTP